MSRSLKHTPCCVMCANKSMKIFANRKVRRRNNKLYNGMSYKKLFNSWNIVDWKDVDFSHGSKDNYWKKCYVRK